MMAPNYTDKQIAAKLTKVTGIKRSVLGVCARRLRLGVSSKDVDGYSIKDVVEIVNASYHGIYKHRTHHGLGRVIRNTVSFSEEELEHFISVYGLRGSLDGYVTVHAFGKEVGFSRIRITQLVNQGKLDSIIKKCGRPSYVPEWLSRAFVEYMGIRGKRGHVRVQCRWNKFIPWAVAKYGYKTV
jgi:hypothetical protein